MSNERNSGAGKPIPRTNPSGKRSPRSYLKLNVASFALAGSLLSVVTWQVGENVAQNLQTNTTTSAQADSANAATTNPNDVSYSTNADNSSTTASSTTEATTTAAATATPEPTQITTTAPTTVATTTSAPTTTKVATATAAPTTTKAATSTTKAVATTTKAPVRVSTAAGATSLTLNNVACSNYNKGPSSG